MPSLIRLFGVVGLSAAAWVFAFVGHGWYSFGVGFSNDILELYAVAFVVSLLASVALAPSLSFASRFSPSAVRGAVVVSVALLFAILMATAHLTLLKRAPLDAEYLVGRAWNVYVYYALFGVTYGVSWLTLIGRQPLAQPEKPT